MLFRSEVESALGAIRDTGFCVLNIDLIYGGDGQTAHDWLLNVREAMKWQAEEIYLYPLYVRPLTGLGKRDGLLDDAFDQDWDARRLIAYRAARDELLTNGYEQISMRMFRRANSSPPVGPVYCCQSDGMVGVGCGARSYTAELHYSTEYAVGKRGVHSILLDYINRDPSDFSAARHGFLLNEDEQQRRFIIQGILQADGLSRPAYLSRFGRDVLTDHACLQQLADWKCARITADAIQLTHQGLERSDAIGPWFYSQQVQQLSRQFELV